MPSKNGRFVLGLYSMIVLAWIVPRTIPADQALAPQRDSIRGLARETVQGKVSAKTDSSLTVDGKVIGTTVATAFVKDGKPITISEVQLGAKVKVVASKESDGSLQAITVEVLQ